MDISQNLKSAYCQDKSLVDPPVDHDQIMQKNMLIKLTNHIYLIDLLV